MKQLYLDLINVLFSIHSLSIKELYIRQSYRNYLLLTKKEKSIFNSQFIFCIKYLLIEEMYDELSYLKKIGYLDFIEVKQFEQLFV